MQATRLMLPITLPTIQNWNCHNCSGCCKQHLIEITEAERQRILDQKWTEADGIPPGQPVVVPHGGTWFKRGHRLAHRPDGACVFLDDRGLCRIHAKFGEAAKPLACRIYPYAFHPGGRRITVSLRFSCPSVVANKGRACTQNKGEINQIAKLVVPEGIEKLPPPGITSRETVDWDDLWRITNTFDELVTDEETPLIPKLFMLLRVADLLSQASLKVIRGQRLDELLELLVATAAEEGVPEPSAPQPIAAIQFRLLVAHYARKDTVADLDAGWWHRWQLLRAALKFAQGQGKTPQLQECFAEVPFEHLEQSWGELPEGTDELLTRYLRVKLQGLHFCGRAYYDVPFVEGFQSLVLIVPAILWIARWLAASNDRNQLMFADIERALAIADHHHGFSPIFGSRGFRQRVNFLARTGELGKLLLWYSR